MNAKTVSFGRFETRFGRFDDDGRLFDFFHSELVISCSQNLKMRVFAQILSLNLSARMYDIILFRDGCSELPIGLARINYLDEKGSTITPMEFSRFRHYVGMENPTAFGIEQIMRAMHPLIYAGVIRLCPTKAVGDGMSTLSTIDLDANALEWLSRQAGLNIGSLVDRLSLFLPARTRN